MTSPAATVQEYLEALPEDRKHAMNELVRIIRELLPTGFSECMNYGMIGYVVPHSLYPKGYHCDTKQPLPFLGLASQKNFISFYHMGLYGSSKLTEWFEAEYPKHSKTKLDMGKSCVRFKKMDQIPYELIGELVSKITPKQWIEMYEENLMKR